MNWKPLILAIWLLAPPVMAQIHTHEEVAGLFYDNSRMALEANRLVERFESMLAGYQPHLNDDNVEVGDFLTVMTQSFAPEQLRRGAIEYLVREADLVRADTLVDWLLLPLPSRIRALEMAAYRDFDANTAVFSDYVETLDMNDERVQRRIELVSRLNATSRVAEFTVETAVALASSMLKAMSPFHRPDQQKSDSEIDSIMDVVRAKQMEQANEILLVRYLYILRGVPGEEIEEYARFFDSEWGQWYVSTTEAGMIEAYRRAGVVAGNSIGPFVKKK